jgi:hypothetical protein
MDSAMNDATCRPFFESNYVVKHLVVNEAKDKQHLENPGAREMLAQYGGEGHGIPYWLVFNAKAELLADSQMRPPGAAPGTKGVNAGCPANEKEVAYFISVLKKTATLTATMEKNIERRFLQNSQ